MSVVKDGSGRVRSIWKIILVFATFFILANLLGVISVFSTVIYLRITHDIGFESVSSDPILMTQYAIGKMSVFFMFLQEAVTIAVPLIAWRFFEKKPFKEMGLGTIKHNKSNFIMGLLLGAISMTVVFLVIVLTRNGALSYSLLTPRFSIGVFINLLLFISVGFGEEILCRGYTMSVLKQTKNISIAIFTSAIIFSLLHIGNPDASVYGMLNIFLVGILFAVMYVKSGSIWMPIGYHITWNYFQGNVFGFKVSGMEQVGIYNTNITTDNIINGGKFGPEGGVIATIVIIIGFLFVNWYYKNNKHNFLKINSVE